MHSKKFLFYVVIYSTLVKTFTGLLTFEFDVQVHFVQLSTAKTCVHEAVRYVIENILYETMYSVFIALLVTLLCSTGDDSVRSSLTEGENPRTDVFL